MNFSELTKSLKRRFELRIRDKNSWGKNELKQVFNDVLFEAQNEAIEIYEEYWRKRKEESLNETPKRVKKFL